MKRLSVYDKSTGLIRFHLPCSGQSETNNIPEGMAAVEGTHDPLSKRVDLSTGEVVDFIPAPPSDDHEWNEATHRWVLREDVATRQARRAAALRELTALDAAEMRALNGQPKVRKAIGGLLAVFKHQEAKREYLQALSLRMHQVD